MANSRGAKAKWKYGEDDPVKAHKKELEQIQDLYLKNFQIYKKNNRAVIKQVIKNCRKIAELFKKIEKGDFIGSYLNYQIDEFEDKFHRQKYFNAHVEYEWLQVNIHNNLKDCNAGFCFKHKINLHYCPKCKKDYGYDEDD